MILTKTPLRISFFGGGSDIPEYYMKPDEQPGFTISTTIDKHIYIAANRCQAPHLKVIYSELELVEDVNDIKHDRVREILKAYGIKSHIEICSFSDVNTRGTGLGSSSTFTVGVLNAVTNMLSIDITRKDLADMACTVEIQLCEQPIGKQDQYAAAFGGFNYITYNKDGTIEVTNPPVSGHTLSTLESNLLMFNTGISRSASNILSNQVKSLEAGSKTLEYTSMLVSMAKNAAKALNQNKLNDFGYMLNHTWDLKKKLSNGISNPEIDTMYEEGMKAGAIGGKLLGAGGGGFMLFFVPPSHRYNMIERMCMMGYDHMPFNFTDKGSTVETNI
jgi:D-glycero-alpha-D-manno-heptose-7-phosphate kinase